MFAFGLLQALKQTNLDFVFKGGTSLLLLLNNLGRLSTDIDIMVKPNTDMNQYIDKACKIFPFTGVSEDIRKGANKIVKSHYKFKFTSPVNGRDLTALLDVVFEDYPYSNIITKEINNSLLLTEEPKLFVKVPNINCMLGDKLTAFCPHTTGIPLTPIDAKTKKSIIETDSNNRVMKQMFDCYKLATEIDCIEQVKETFDRVVNVEIGYRDTNIKNEDVLKDIIYSCLNLINRGATSHEEYPSYIDGIGKLKGHIIGNEFNGQTASIYACRILYVAASLLKNNTNYLYNLDIDKYLNENLNFKGCKKYSSIKSYDLLSFSYPVESYKLLQDEFFVI